MKSKKITKKTRINELLMKSPKSAEILFEAGMGCVGCPMAQQETIEQGCKAHGFSEEEIKELVDKINGKK
ncbi:MAG: DUF1858 domain-containing protein [Nanoarchaeota archaeon]|nr:DUF1858 domain-containing protein [Nanoarchaeota archaeon]